MSCSEFGEENTLVAQDSSQNMLFRSYVIFYSETKDQLKDWAKQWALLWSATTSSQFCWKIHLTQKMEWLVAARNLQSIKTFLTLELSQYIKSGSMFSSSASCCPQRLLQTLKHPVFVLASPTCPSCAWALFPELACWFCPLNLWLPSRTAFGEIAKLGLCLLTNGL